MLFFYLVNARLAYVYYIKGNKRYKEKAMLLNFLLIISVVEIA